MAGLRDILFADEAAPNTKVSDPAQAAPATPAAPTKKPGASSLSMTGSVLAVSAAGAQSDAERPRRNYGQFKQKIHNKLIESIDLRALEKIEGGKALETAVETAILSLLAEEELPLTAGEQRQLARDVLNETLGLGPLEPLLNDPAINDILVNRFDSVWVDRHGKLEQTEVTFMDEEHLIRVINRIVARVGRRVDESSPIVDARLPDGSRVNAIIPPLALDGPILSIRRFRSVPYEFLDLVSMGCLTRPMADFLAMAVKARLNILVSGGTSAGKTTLLNVLSGHISDDERIVTIEDTAELRLQQRHVLRLESRPANIEGQGSVSQRELVKNALRMRPDRIIVGEVRGGEALDMLQAMNTGHEGSMTTVHANTPRDALSRIETLVLLAGIELSQRSIREQIASAFDLILQIKRLSDGRRIVVSVTEVTGVQEGVISLQELFTFKTIDVDEAGKVNGKHLACNIRPQFEQKFHEAGLEIKSEMFTELEPA
jgi:pilus assembly protein CpaF